MRISELVDHRVDISPMMRSKGYRLLGSGADAMVWIKDSGPVIKLLIPRVPHTDDANAADLAFLVFYEFCRDNKNNPFLPKFVEIEGSHYTDFKIGDNYYKQIAMEMLDQIPNNSTEEYMVWMLGDMVIRTNSWERAKEKMNQEDTWLGYRTAWKKYVESIKNPDFEKYYHALFLTMVRLFAVGNSAGLKWDLHTENAMMRDRQIVIIDPFYGG